jgi:hypothetical protein
MWPSLKPTQRVSLIGVIPPQSATTVQSTGYVSVANAENFLAVVNVGAMIATGLVDAKLMQATSAGGAGAKALNNVAGTALAITEFTYAADANDQALINVNAAQLDTNNGFTFIALLITPSVEAALISGELWAFDVKIPLPGGAASQLASVVQIVS